MTEDAPVETVPYPGGARIVSVALVVRAGDEDWAKTESSVSIEVEPGWPAHVALAAAQGGLRSALKAVEEEYQKAIGQAVRDEGGDDETDDAAADVPDPEPPE